MQRLWRAFDGALGWQIDGFLLTWLLAHGGADEVQRRIPALLAWLPSHPADGSVRASLLALRGAQGQPALADLLDRSLNTLGRETRAFRPASAALVAAATLGPADLPLIVRWVGWAAEVLEAFTANRSAHAVATSLNGLIDSATRHAGASGCPPDDRAAVQAALRRVLVARGIWHGSVGYLPTR